MKDELPREIIDIVNFEFKKKNYNITICKDFFKTYDIEFKKSDLFKKEVMISLDSYYNVFLNEKVVKFFYLLHAEIKNLFKYISENNNEDKILKQNDIFLLTVWNFYEKNESLSACFYTILILKSILNNDKKNIFVSSDLILNKIVILFKNFLIFFNNYEFSINILKTEDVRKHFFIIFEFLINKNVIDSETVWVKKDMIKNIIISERFWGIKEINEIIINNKFDFFLFKPTIKHFKKNYYIIGYYYSKIYCIFHKNIKSNLIFEFFDKNYLDQLCFKEWYIDLEWFEKIIALIKEKEDVPNDNYFKKIVKELEDCKWKNVDLQKEYSKYIKFNNIINFYYYAKININDNPIYFPFYFDFRGRLYYDSSVSITNAKILRTIYHYGWYNTNNYVGEIDLRFDVLLDRYKNEIYTIKNNYNITLNHKKININIVMVLISIGKINIDKKWKIHMDEFISQAFKNLNCNFSNITSLNDYIEAKSYENIFINFKDMKKRILIKDFTASFFQHLTRLLGPKTEKTLELANMSNDMHWNDPYTFIIEEFTDKYKEIKNIQHFTRKNLKKTIMTIPYSIGKTSAWGYFKEDINNDESKDIILKKEFELFFKFAKNKLDGNEFFNNSSDKIILYAISKSYWKKNVKIKLEKASVHLIYYKSKSKIIDLIIKINKNNIRITKKINEIDNNEIDYENIALSVRANWIAMMDGETLRKINRKIGYILYSIHDCVLVDWLNTDSLVLVCNDALKENDIEDITWDNSHNFIVFSFFIII